MSAARLRLRLNTFRLQNKEANVQGFKTTRGLSKRDCWLFHHYVVQLIPGVEISKGGISATTCTSPGFQRMLHQCKINFLSKRNSVSLYQWLIHFKDRRRGGDKRII